MTKYALYDEENKIIRYVNKNVTGAILTKQGQMFERDQSEISNEYTAKIEAPIYEPKNIKPHILTLCDKSRSKKLKKAIYNANVSDDEKQFLLDAAARLNIFNYELIADYYAHSNKEMQALMESMALVIIDFNKAIELGFVQLSDDIRTQYLEFYGE